MRGNRSWWPAQARIAVAASVAIAAVGVAPVGAGARGIAVPSASQTAYVTTFDANAGGLTPFAVGNRALGAPFATGGFNWSIAITPDGTKAYTTDIDASAVVPIDLVTHTAGAPILIDGDPVGIAITPDGTMAYVTVGAANTVVPIDLATSTVGAAIQTGAGPQGIAIAPDGTTAYAADGDGTVTPIDIATNAAEPLINLHSPGDGIAISPDGRTAYVTSDAGGAGRVIPIRLATRKRGNPIIVGGTPKGIVFSADGATAFVADYTAGRVVPIVTATKTVGADISPIPWAYDIALTPDQAPVASFTATPVVHGNATSFDASASYGPSSAVVSYRWKFGDGTIEVTTTPFTTHTYTASGAYTVALRVTDAGGTSTTQVFTGRTVIRNGGPSARKTRTVVIS